MIKKRLLHFIQLSAVGFTGYYVGQNKDNFANILNEDSVIVNGNVLKKMPGLPIFGTVSAAAPYVESGADRVSTYLILVSHIILIKHKIGMSGIILSVSLT